MKILHVFRAPLGGLFRHVTDLVRGQAARGHQVGIVADSLTGNVRSKEVLIGLAPVLALGLTLTPMPRELSPLDIAATLCVGRRARRVEADVLHGHGAKGGAYARLAYVGRPAVRAYTPHGGSLLLDHASLTGRAYLAMERVLKPRGNLYLFESAFSARIYHDKVGRPAGFERVTHNGVSPAEFEPVSLSPDATDLLFVGELRAVKGIDILLEAVARLRAEGRMATVTLVGDGPDAAALQALAERLSLTAAVRFLPGMAMREALRLGRLMVIPSRAESLPYVVLETAAAGRALIATNVGGIPEIYGPLSHALVPPGDVAALARTIDLALADPAATAAMADSLRAQLAASFSLDAMVDGVLAGYGQALARTALRGPRQLAQA